MALETQGTLGLSFFFLWSSRVNVLRANVQLPLEAPARSSCVWRRKQAVPPVSLSAVCTAQVLVLAVSLNPSGQVFPRLRYSGVLKVAWI